MPYTRFPATVGQRTVADEAEYIGLLLRCPHEHRHGGQYDPGQMYSNDLVRVTVCYDCGAVFLAVGPAVIVPPDVGGGP